MNTKQDGPLKSPQSQDWHELALSHFAVLTYTQLIPTKRIGYSSFRKCLMALTNQAFKTDLYRSTRLHIKDHSAPLSSIVWNYVLLRMSELVVTRGGSVGPLSDNQLYSIHTLRHRAGRLCEEEEKTSQERIVTRHRPQLLDLERGCALWNTTDRMEVDKPNADGYRNFTDSLCISSNGCRPDAFPEGESRTKKAAA